MATSLGKVGIVDRGNYLQEEIYNAGDFVLYNGSTWLALKDGLLGAEPAEGTNWKYLAKGFEAEVLSMITANDTSGLLGDAEQQVNAQNLIDVIADKVATKLIEKGSIVNNAVTTVEGTVLDGRMGKALQDQITDVNNNINFYKIVESPQTIESLVSNAEKNSHYAVIATYFPEDLPAKNAECWIDIKVESNGRKLVFVSTSQSSAIYKRVWFSGWKSEWIQYITNSDLPKLYYKIKSPQNAGNPTQAIKDNWYTIPDGSYLCEIEVGSVCTGIVQKIEDGNYGSVYIISYGLITPIYMRKELDSWFVK